jgi:hypothetical protein
MKRIATLILIFPLLLQGSMKLAIFTYYQVNKNYIAATLCENKEKPAMQCNGKCYLAKKMKSQEQREQKNPSLFQGLEELNLFCSDVSILLPVSAFSINCNKSFFYVVKRYNSPLSDIFQPPGYLL